MIPSSLSKLTLRLTRRSLALLTLSLGLSGCNKPGNATQSAPADSASPAAPAPVTLLNVSYDPTRELYTAFNAHFAKKWEAEHHQKVTINQSHGGGGKQARAVIDPRRARARRGRVMRAAPDRELRA